MVTISLIIPTFRRPHHLSNLLNSIERQTFNRSQLDVVVVGNLSCSTSEKLCQQARSRGLNISYSETGLVGVNHARNKGLQLATGNILVFLDDDCVLSDDLWIQNIDTKFAEDPNLDGVGGFYNLAKGYSFWGLVYHIKLRAWLRYFSSTGRAYRMLGGCMAFRKNSLNSTRFDDSIVFGGAETDFVLRLLELNLKFKLYEELSISHSFDISLLAFIKKVFRQGRYHQISQNLEKKVMGHFSPPQSFKFFQDDVIQKLDLSYLEKKFVSVGLKIHKSIFYW